MKKQNEYGICKICGKNKILTEEHIPPKSLFNDGTYKIYSQEEVLKTITGEERLPWEFDGLKYKIKQGGRRYKTLCSECNSYMGSNYINYFQSISKSFYKFLIEKDYKNANRIEAQTDRFRPNPFINAVLSMFASITNISEKENIKEFLLNKSSCKIDIKPYRLFMSVFKNGLERLCGWNIFVSKSKNGIKKKIVSEIVAMPFIFVLLNDSADNLTEEDTIGFGAEITNFKDFVFEQEVSLKVDLPINECNINFPCDYRTQEQIKECRERNKKQN